MRQEEKDKISGFEAARARLTSIAYRMLGSRAEAEDIVQDAWLKWHAASESDFHTPLAWLTTVTTRLAIDRIRRLQSEQTARANESLAQPWLDDMAPSAEDEALHASSVAQAVALLFERLSDDERAAFVLHEAFDYDYAQIAEVVGKTPAHCRQLAHRARRRLTSAQESEANGPLRGRAQGGASRAGNPERLREIIRNADAFGAMRLFADPGREVEVAGAGAVRSVRELASASFAQDVSPLARCAPFEAHVLPSVSGAAVALVRECEIVGIVRVACMRTDAGRIALHISFVTGGAQVEALDRRYGSLAISRLLARIARPEPAATALAAA